MGRRRIEAHGQIAGDCPRGVSISRRPLVLRFSYHLIVESGAAKDSNPVSLAKVTKT